MIPITTERLIIRRFAPSDLPDLLAYQPHPGNSRYQQVEPFTEERATQYLEKQSTLELTDAGGWFGFAIQLRTEARMIGEVGVFLPPAPRDKGDIGWALNPDYQKNGYATEAAQALLRYVFEELKLHRVTAGCDTRNIPSVRVMERLGMRREGHSVQSTYFQDAWRDSYSYALLRDEWLKAITKTE